MKTYSIVKTGGEYVVLAGEQRVLKVGSRTQARGNGVGKLGKSGGYDGLENMLIAETERA